MTDEVINVTVRNMIEADLRGIDVHVAGTLPIYNEGRKLGENYWKGVLTTIREFAAITLLDSGNAFGHYATSNAMKLASGKATDFGMDI